MATKDPLLEANNKLIAEKETLVNENKDLQLKLQVISSTIFHHKICIDPPFHSGVYSIF